MSINRKATMAKRQRELDQKDRARAREQRRADRRAARNGTAAPDPTDLPENEQPVLGVDGPRSLAELRARAAETTPTPPPVKPEE